MKGKAFFTSSRIKLFLIILIALQTISAQVVCNKFELQTNLINDVLDLSIDTDLPDYTSVMVTVRRSYWEKGSSAEYSVDYFLERSTVGKWKSTQKVSVDSKKWKTLLREKQEKMAGFGIGFDVGSISDNISVSMIVPVRQPDSRFGEKNSKLTGTAVNTSGSRFVEDEIDIPYPLDSPPTGKSPYPNLDPFELEIGIKYVVEKQTPLMPHHSPSDPVAALNKIKQIPQNGNFKVLDKFNKRSLVWYQVVAYDKRNSKIGNGWINSTALIGQKLKAY